MPYVNANGLRLHVQHLGQPTAPPVVMVHGMLSGSVASWYFGLAPVLAETHRVVLYDQRGHGLSERPLRGYTLTELAADLDALTESLGPCAVVGHSFGGMVGLRHAINHPDRVAALVLVDSFVPGSADEPRPGSGADGPRGADGGGMDIETMRTWERDRRRSGERITPLSTGSSGRGGPGRRRRRATGEQILLGGTTVLSDLRRDSQLDPEALAALPMPLLCVRGSASPFRAEVDDLARRLPPARFRTEVLDGGHALHLDAPEELAAVVSWFLGRLDPLGADSPVGVSAGGGLSDIGCLSGGVRPTDRRRAERRGAERRTAGTRGMDRRGAERRRADRRSGPGSGVAQAGTVTVGAGAQGGQHG